MLRASLRPAPLALLLALACDGAATTPVWDDAEFQARAREAIEAHADLVVASYADCLSSASTASLPAPRGP